MRVKRGKCKGRRTLLFLFSPLYYKLFTSSHAPRLSLSLSTNHKFQLRSCSDSELISVLSVKTKDPVFMEN